MDGMSMEGTGNASSSSMMMMSMAFHAGHDEVVLFDFWKISSPAGLALSMAAFFLLAVAYEGIKYFRDHLVRSCSFRRIRFKPEAKTSPVEDADEEDNQCFQAFGTSMISWGHFALTLLQMVQVTVSYLIMLVVMTYNVWLCMAVVLGIGVGYFIFGWKKTAVLDMSDACH